MRTLKSIRKDVSSTETFATLAAQYYVDRITAEVMIEHKLTLPRFKTLTEDELATIPDIATRQLELITDIPDELLLTLEEAAKYEVNAAAQVILDERIRVAKHKALLDGNVDFDSALQS